MPNQDLIDYMNSVKQANLAKVTSLDLTLSTIDEMIAQMNANIDNYNTQKTSVGQQKTDLQADNVSLDEIITILSA